MKESYFSNAYKYTESKDSSHLENFTTESFVFILKYLIKEFPCDAKKILLMFNLEIEDLSNLKIETQKIFYTPFDFIDEHKIPIKVKEAIPDIVLYESITEKTIIEVKIDAELNKYYLKDGTIIDQVDFYKNIKGVKNVYTLSKHYIDKNEFNCKVRWYEIFKSLENNDSYIINEFREYLSENRMGERKMITNDCINIVDTVDAFTSLIKDAWEISGINNMKINSYPYITPYGFGFYILNKKERNSATKDFSHFIGINKTETEKYKSAITYWVADKPKKGVLSNFEELDSNGYVLKVVIKLQDLIKVKNRDKQEELVSDWLKNKVKPML